MFISLDLLSESDDARVNVSLLDAVTSPFAIIFTRYP